jgi:DNA processing protein
VEALHQQQVFERAAQEAEFIRHYRITPLFCLDPAYPEKLRHCEDAPMMLYFKGQPAWSGRRILSVVGTRSPTGYGREVCEQIIQGLGGLGVLIVSGLAYGIDTIAHRAALAGDMPTIGVLAHGLDTVYPYVNRPLAEKMLENGGLITEFISRTRLNRDYFPRRNRVIAGMADATLVIESADKGGALITADIANSYNRDVFAVPGRVNDAKSSGCNRLIHNNKANLVQSASDICYLMGWDEPHSSASRQQKLFHELDDDERKIYSLLSIGKEAGIDDIYLGSGMTAGQVAAVLLKLEFEGLVKCLPGKRYRLC